MSANYEPMSEVRKTFKVAWYRCPIEPETLRMLTKRCDLKGWLRHDLLLQPRIDHP